MSKGDDTENEKNDYTTDEGNRQGQYKHLFDAAKYIRKIFYSQLNTYKDSYKLFIISLVSCSDKFFIKRVISSSKKKNGFISFIVRFSL